MTGEAVNAMHSRGSYDTILRCCMLSCSGTSCMPCQVCLTAKDSVYETEMGGQHEELAVSNCVNEMQKGLTQAMMEETIQMPSPARSVVMIIKCSCTCTCTLYVPLLLAPCLRVKASCLCEQLVLTANIRMAMLQCFGIIHAPATLAAADTRKLVTGSLASVAAICVCQNLRRTQGISVMVGCCMSCLSHAVTCRISYTVLSLQQFG